jgi:hypothetical protein
MKAKRIAAAGVIMAAACAGTGLATASSASALPAQSAAARQSVATAAVGDVGTSPQFITAVVDDVADAAEDAVDVAGEASDYVSDVATEYAGQAFNALTATSSGADHQAISVPALRGAVPADAQFNAG